MTSVIRKTLNYDAFAAASGTAEVAVFTPDRLCAVRAALLSNTVNFTGGAVNACTVSLGSNTPTTTNIMAAKNVYNHAVGIANAVAGVTGNSQWTAVLPRGTPVYAQMLTTGANTNVLNTGQLQVWLEVDYLPDAIA